MIDLATACSSSSPAEWPAGVVDGLEPVDVDERHQQALAGATRPVELALDRGAADAPEQRSGERVDALERELLGGLGTILRGSAAVVGGLLAVACGRLAVQCRLRAARSGALAVARRAQQDLDADRRAAVFAPAVALEPLDLGVERGGQLVARPGCAVALAGHPVAARRGLVAHARGVRSCLRRQIALDGALRPLAPAALVFPLLGGILDDMTRVVVIGGILIAIGGDLVAVGGVLIGVRRRLVQVRGGLIAVGRGLIEVGERLEVRVDVDAADRDSAVCSCDRYASLLGRNIAPSLEARPPSCGSAPASRFSGIPTTPRHTSCREVERRSA